MHGLFGAPDGHGGLLRNLSRALQGAFQQRLWRLEYLIDQAIAQRFLRAQAPSGVGQLFHYGQRNELGQALQRAHVGHHADVDFLNAEKRIGCGVANAARRHHVHRAANAAALNRCNHGHAKRFQLGESSLHVAQQVKHGSPAFGALVVHGHRA